MKRKITIFGIVILSTVAFIILMEVWAIQHSNQVQMEREISLQERIVAQNEARLEHFNVRLLGRELIETDDGSILIETPASIVRVAGIIYYFDICPDELGRIWVEGSHWYSTQIYDYFLYMGRERGLYHDFLNSLRREIEQLELFVEISEEYFNSEGRLIVTRLPIEILSQVLEQKGIELWFVDQ